MSSAELETLISRVSLGDRAAFAALYDAIAPKLLGVTLRILHDRASAEDAMQDAFVKIWRNADRYAVTGHSPMTWFITIARNAPSTGCASAAPRGRDRTGRHAARNGAPASKAIARSEAARIAACLGELEPDRRAAVRGAYLEGRSYADLAAILRRAAEHGADLAAPEPDPPERVPEPMIDTPQNDRGDDPGPRCPTRIARLPRNMR